MQLCGVAGPLALLLAASVGAQSMDAQSVQTWITNVQGTIDANPQAKQLVTTFLARLNNPYELQRACWKPSFGRGRGLGRSRCDLESDHPEPGGALCYRKCREGYTSDGVTLCWKSISDVYSRGAGVRRSCQPDETEEAALCYKTCPAGFVGVGPVCWKSCSADTYPFYAVDYGAMCCATAEACKKQMFEMAVKFPALWARVVVSGLSGNYAGAVANAKVAVDGAMAFALPICGDPIFQPPRPSSSMFGAAVALAEAEAEASPNARSPLAVVEPVAEVGGERAGALAEGDAAAALAAALADVTTKARAYAAERAAAADSSVSATSLMDSLLGGNCFEMPRGWPLSTCAAQLRAGRTCAELVTAGYDCRCSCIDRSIACWKNWTFRGVGEPPRRCNASSYYPDLGGGLCYASCAPGYRSDGASQCHKSSLWPPGGSTVYSRGSGDDRSCASDEEEDGGLCYKRCAPGYTGAGPICWADCDQRGPMPINGGAICCSSAQECGRRIIGLISDIPFAFADAAVAALSAGAINPNIVMQTARDLAAAVNGFELPTCSLSAIASPDAPDPNANSTAPAITSTAIAIQHMLQLLGGGAGGLPGNSTELAAQLAAELAALLGISTSRFKLDMYQPLISAAAAGSWNAPSLANHALVAFSILPADAPAPTAVQLSAELLAKARAALAALQLPFGIGARRRRLWSDAPTLFDPTAYPLLSRAVGVESALDVADVASLEALICPAAEPTVNASCDVNATTLSDFAPVLYSMGSDRTASWRQVSNVLRRGSAPAPAQPAPTPTPARAEQSGPPTLATPTSIIPRESLGRMSMPLFFICAGSAVASAVLAGLILWGVRASRSHARMQARAAKSRAVPTSPGTWVMRDGGAPELVPTSVDSTRLASRA